MKNSWNFKFIKCISAIFFCVAFFQSCSNYNDNKSFISLLDEADDFIKKGEVGSALKSLKKASKNSSSVYSDIGIFKRFMTLGEYKLAEKFLQENLKTKDDNLELSALYTHFLLRQKRNKEALEYSKILKGSKYGSLYSEAFFKCNQEYDFFSNKIIDIYLDLYTSTNNQKWLINAALPYLLEGEYIEASDLQEEIKNNEDSFFWALVHYDAKKYDLCLKNLDAIQNYYDSGEFFSLASDAYVMLEEYDLAEKERNKLLNLKDSVDLITIPENLIINSSIWSFVNEDYKRAYDLLFSIILRNPESVSGLLTYGKFAKAESKISDESELDLAVKKTGLKTMKMKKFDDRPKFLIDDIIFRIDSYLKKCKEEKKSCDEDLLVEKVSLFLEKNNNLPVNSVESFLWQILEENEIEKNYYPSLLVNFVLGKLLSFNKIDDARLLFTKYIDAKYNKDENEKLDSESKKIDIFGGEINNSSSEVQTHVLKALFGDMIIEHMNKMEIWEVEYSAYFSLFEGNYSVAKRLYEYILFETDGINVKKIDSDVRNISVYASIPSIVNLAMLYSSLGQLKESSTLYSLAIGKIVDNELKSQIMYRNALIHIDLNDEQSALLILDYAIAIDPSNVSARLLKKQLTMK